MGSNYMFTSESVTEGHPDKVADQISDAILDAMLTDDPESRVACETLVTTGMAIVAGEVTTKTYVDIPQIVRGTIREIGYSNSSMGFDWETCAVMTSLDKQSPDIAMGVDADTAMFGEQGAGDQGLMFGYACDETPELMPMPIYYAHKLARRLAAVRKNGSLGFLRPDGKTQVTIEYEDDRPKRVEAVVVAAQHSPDVKQERLREAIIEEVVRKILPAEMIDGDTKMFINTTGRFVVGGPHGDCGLTGRKIIVDTYGGQGSHGGGCFSGKDPSKVDRSGSYFSRYVAKNIVAAGLARKCEVQIAYAIGVPQPVSILVHTYGTETVDNDRIVAAVRKVFDFRPAMMIQKLQLKQPMYRRTAAYGHFGREEDGGFTWERRDMVEALKAAV
ncbi:S-adenosylmethionine synthetase [Desulfarculus baarsii DSM 2075]|uniref:S-adenosylmethionine synthase n=1 Tax=Desulfarculus baarsii (strain ATCC 33931 / DSM 2075 / LMG 7858 / VKM B-1802 / 2st14) TaxID=644282 RepID=E1QFH1_DESB2|nr:methionine adenosyltransferase [Desulfarculus baarsii]ADK84307.1 S-adenosylmethionine synthetase [Desulfarculus baarsii DSM 2075]